MSRKIRVATAAGQVEIAASAVVGDFAVHRRVEEVSPGVFEAKGDRWYVSHLPTGRSVLSGCYTAKHGKVAAEMLSGAEGMSAKVSALVGGDKRAKREVERFVAGLHGKSWDRASRI